MDSGHLKFAWPVPRAITGTSRFRHVATLCRPCLTKPTSLPECQRGRHRANRGPPPGSLEPPGPLLPVPIKKPEANALGRPRKVHQKLQQQATKLQRTCRTGEAHPPSKATHFTREHLPTKASVRLRPRKLDQQLFRTKVSEFHRSPTTAPTARAKAS